MAEEEKAEAPAKSSLIPIIGAAVGSAVLAAGGTFFVAKSMMSAPAASAEAASEGDHSASEAGNSEAEHGEGHEEKKSEEHGGGAARAEAGHGGGGEHGEAPSGDGSGIFELETFIVNINDGERDRFLKLKPELELSDPAVGEELKARMPYVKDSVIGLLSSQNFSEIRTLEGKDLLREEMMVRLNALLKSGKVKRVFFTELVVQ
jgi:flagellar protein FliL